MTLTALAAMQHATGALGPGEEYLAAIRISDPDEGRPLRDPILGGVGMLLAARDPHVLEEVATITLPSTGGIVGVTETRVVVYGVGFRLRPTDLLGVTDRAGVTLDTETFHASLVKREHIRLLDGDTTFLDASVRASNPDLPALRTLIPPSA